MLFCNLTPLDGRFVNAIVFCRKSEFCQYITSLHIQHSIYVRQFEFFVFTMNQIASIFCNLSFAGQYIFLLTFFVSIAFFVCVYFVFAFFVPLLLIIRIELTCVSALMTFPPSVLLRHRSIVSLMYCCLNVVLFK